MVIHCNRADSGEECDLTRYVKRSGGVIIAAAWDTSIPTGIGWESTKDKKKGLKEPCDLFAAVGCTKYTCQESK